MSYLEIYKVYVLALEGVKSGQMKVDWEGRITKVSEEISNQAAKNRKAVRRVKRLVFGGKIINRHNTTQFVIHNVS